jgi:hypothetical protein
MATLAEKTAIIDQVLATLPAPEAGSTRQAILARKTALQEKSRAGYPADQLARRLTEAGLPITTNSLRTYLAEGGAKISKAARTVEEIERRKAQALKASGQQIEVDGIRGPIVVDAESIS